MTQSSLQTHHVKKHFGQNFLQDQGVIARIIAAIQPKKDDFLLEIGPGLGALTQPLLDCVNHLHVIEIDRDAITHLEETIQSRDKLTIHQGDVLKFDFRQLLGGRSSAFAEDDRKIAEDDRKIAGDSKKTAKCEGKTAEGDGSFKLRIVGNLPYNISTPILFHLVDHFDLIQDIHVMLQKEVVERICAKPSNKAYGRLSVVLQYYFQADYVFTVPPHAFKPQPKVDSAILRLTPRAQSELTVKDEKAFIALVKAAFANRRKTLRNNLKGLLAESQIEAAGINPAARAETLSVQAFIDLAQQG